MVVCYDAHASPIRDMQRCGRTGRHRSGRVVQLLAVGKEEADYEKQQLASPCPIGPSTPAGPLCCSMTLKHESVPNQMVEECRNDRLISTQGVSVRGCHTGGQSCSLA